MQSMSYRSDGSFMAGGDTPRSGDGSVLDLERKVRGGMTRSLSHVVASPLHPASLPACTSAACLSTWERAARRASGASSGGRLGDRLASDSSLGSPGAESTLLGSAPTSPTVVVPLGGGYSRVSVQPAGHPPQQYTRVQSLAPLQVLSDFQRTPPASPGPPAPPAGQQLMPMPSLSVRADMVARGTALSRTTTDTHGIVAAVASISQAAAAIPAQQR